MTVLITGASGFLGGALARALAAREEPVRILARRTSALRHLAGAPVDVVYGALEDPESLRAACRGARVVYHCAGLSTDWASWERFYQVNVTGVRNLTAAALAAGSVERFLHVSTSDVYGYPRRACDESHPITDVGLPYNRSKGLGEQAVWEAQRESGLPVTVVRPVSIYGPRSQDFVTEIASLLLQGQMLLVDGGRARAGLLYIDNAVDALIAAATLPQAVGQVYNLRDEGDETWAAYVGALAEGLGTRPPWLNLPSGVALAAARLFELAAGALRLKGRPLLTRHAVYLMFRDQGYAIDKARRELGFRSRVGFSEGVTRTLAWLATAEGRAALGQA